MTRTKGSKNKPKFTQMSFETTGVPDLATYEESLEQDEVINIMEIKNVLRVINQGNLVDIEEGLNEYANKGLNEYLRQGWKLFNTHFGGMMPEGMIIIYVFTRELSAN